MSRYQNGGRELCEQPRKVMCAEGRSKDFDVIKWQGGRCGWVKDKGAKQKSDR